MVSACEKGHRWDKAVEFFETMGVAHGFRKDVVTYTTSIAALSHSHKWQETCEKLAEMFKSRLYPNVTTYSALITALQLAQQWQRALLGFEMLSSVLEPDAVSLNACIKAAATGTQWIMILHLLHEFDERALQPDGRTFASSISGLTKAGQWQKSLHYLERCLQTSSQDLDFTDFAVPVNAALFGLAKQWLWQRVMELLAASEKHVEDTQLRVSAEVRSAFSKQGQAVEKHCRQIGMDPLVSLRQSAHAFYSCFDKLEQGAPLPRLEYNNSMIAFESSPEGCHTFRDALSRLRLQNQSKYPFV